MQKLGENGRRQLENGIAALLAAYRAIDHLPGSLDDEGHRERPELHERLEQLAEAIDALDRYAINPDDQEA